MQWKQHLQRELQWHLQWDQHLHTKHVHTQAHLFADFVPATHALVRRQCGPPLGHTLCAVGLNIHILKLGCTCTAVSQLLYSYLQHHALVSVTCCLCVTISTVIEVFFGSGAGPPTQHNLLPLWPDHLLGGDQVLLDCNHRRQCSEHGIDDESQTSCLPNTSPYGAMPFNLANRGLQNMTWYPTPGTSSRLCKSACCADASSDMRPGLC